MGAILAADMGVQNEILAFGFVGWLMLADDDKGILFLQRGEQKAPPVKVALPAFCWLALQWFRAGKDRTRACLFALVAHYGDQYQIEGDHLAVLQADTWRAYKEGRSR